MTTTYSCPICGYPGLNEPARDSHALPSYDICSSCGFEYGVTDDDQGFTYTQWREKWVAQGMPWWAEGLEPQPVNWDPKAQLASLGA